jgi:hypothetical protein
MNVEAFAPSSVRLICSTICVVIEVDAVLYLYTKYICILLFAICRRYLYATILQRSKLKSVL